MRATVSRLVLALFYAFVVYKVVSDYARFKSQLLEMGASDWMPFSIVVVMVPIFSIMAVDELVTWLRAAIREFKK